MVEKMKSDTIRPEQVLADLDAELDDAKRRWDSVTGCNPWLYRK